MISCPACDEAVGPDDAACGACGLELRPYRLLLGLPGGFFNEGLLRAKGGDLDGAIESLAVAVALDTNDAEAELVLGKLYARRSNHRMARIHFERALAIQARLKWPPDSLHTTRGLLAAVGPTRERQQAKRPARKRHRQ